MSIQISFLRHALICSLGLVLSCSSENKENFTDWDANRLYSEAKGMMLEGDYTKAIRLYGALEAQFPFGKYAQQALLDTAYSHYKQDELDEAISSSTRFIKLYPQSRHLDYAWYLRGIAMFNKGKGFTQRYLPTDESQRDTSSARDAFQSFSHILRNYPGSLYTKDSRQRMIYLRNILASHEVHIANYYMRLGAFLSAANRARYVLEHYPRTPAIPTALVLLARAYKILELPDLHSDVMRVLRVNYPDLPSIAEIERSVVE
ncbi:MAG: outer membrane protein assembly factor BamD [Candidatus Eutrophobiaceae bacterium]